ncbi:MAG: molybdenum cofactor biosynthesis protein MoaE [Candidatus Eisenbacteria bacterium]|uniref:Molybdenum cofactor biosynthesis protein MoaE n=1 Tax=Eiseniibacteriota bacterium TaxID=2212470 RepID=A0A933SDQ2_UNCEI|nr:molybdenum cofactor biosynthesis protein MoaE [Candidatus Eisenbacteria bacterium]
MATLSHEPLDAAAATAALQRRDCGAVLTFLGTTRDHHDGRHVTRLSYEAYEPMALRELEALERESCERFEIEACTVAHRLGEVPPAEPSVVVVVASHHRGPAFDACRWVMDELKKRVPIWKKETYAEGGEEWVSGTKLEG